MGELWTKAVEQLPALTLFSAVMVWLVTKFLSHLSVRDQREEARDHQFAEDRKASEERFTAAVKEIGDGCHRHQEDTSARVRDALKDNSIALKETASALGRAAQALDARRE